MFLTVKGFKPKNLCKAYRCQNHTYGGKNLCPRHEKMRQKEINPVAYYYNALKQNAKRRGKTFTITLDWFREFCKETKYLELKGKSKNSASLDRINPNKGYEPGNIQVLSLSENSKKQYEDECPF